MRILYEEPDCLLMRFLSDCVELQFGHMGNVTCGTRNHAGEIDLVRSCRNTGLYDLMLARDRYRNFYKTNIYDFPSFFEQLSREILRFYTQKSEPESRTSGTTDLKHMYRSKSVIIRRSQKLLFIEHGRQFSNLYTFNKIHIIRHHLVLDNLFDLQTLWKNKQVYNYFKFPVGEQIKHFNIFKFYQQFYRTQTIKRYAEQKYKMQQTNMILAKKNELNNTTAFSKYNFFLAFETRKFRF